MIFWDASALVSLLIAEQHAAEVAVLWSKEDAFAWILTPLESLSALARLQRTGFLKEKKFEDAKELLADLRRELIYIEDIAAVQAKAERLIFLHPLKAADALQLAAALVACQDSPSHSSFVTLDKNLAACAKKEGFKILPSA